MMKTDGYATLDAVKAAVEARSSSKFGVEFDKLTQACNACHRATHFGFIKIQVPTASPFSDQSFVPPPNDVRSRRSAPARKRRGGARPRRPLMQISPRRSNCRKQMSKSDRLERRG